MNNFDHYIKACDIFNRSGLFSNYNQVNMANPSFMIEHIKKSFRNINDRLDNIDFDDVDNVWSNLNNLIISSKCNMGECDEIKIAFDKCYFEFCIRL